MNLDHDFVLVWKFSEDPKKKQMEHIFPQIQLKTKRKKKVFSKNRTLFPQFYAQMYTDSNYWGVTVKLLDGGYIIPHPPLFRQPWLYNLFTTATSKGFAEFCNAKITSMIFAAYCIIKLIISTIIIIAVQH